MGNGGLGRVATTTDVCALVLSGPAALGLPQNTPARLFSVQGAEALGITSTSHPHAHAQISAFFGLANGAGLWIALVPDTTLVSAVVGTAGAMEVLLNAAIDTITLAGVSIRRAVGYAPGAGYFDYDLAAVANQAQTMAQLYAAKYAPLRIVLDGSYLNGAKYSAGDALPALAGVGDRVCVFAGAEAEGDRHAAMGRLMGWLASAPIHESAGRVKRGAFAGLGYLTTGVAIDKYQDAQIDALHQAGIMALRRFAGKGGAYITNGVTLAANTSDFKLLALGRVIDKAIRLSYLTYVDEINETVEITAEGKLAPTRVSYLEDRIENALRLRMTAEGNISSARCLIDPKQDVLATSRIEVQVRIIPLGYLEEIVVKLGFENPAQRQ